MKIPGGAAQPKGPMPTDDQLLMAAAIVHEQGRLFYADTGEEEKRLREQFSGDMMDGVSSRLGNGKFGLDRELEIFFDERDRFRHGEGTMQMSPRQLRERGY